MKLRTSNYLSMIGSCLVVANKPEHFAVWNGQQPLAFTNTLMQVQASHTALTGKASLIETAGSGAADTKAIAEAALENRAHVLARALTVHYKSTGDAANRVHVDLSRTEIVRLRGNDLISKTTAIRDLAAAAQTEPEAADHGVTSARTDGLTAALDGFKKVVDAPRGQIVSRSTLLKELDTDTAALLEKLANLDDLILQFEGTAAGDRFIEDWNRARIIVDRIAEQPKLQPSPTPAPAA